jgi:hypothetical protein
MVNLKINEENLSVDVDNSYASYTLENGDVLEVSLYFGKTNHFGEELEVLDYIEPIENSYSIENENDYIEALYEYLIDKVQFK